MKARKIGGVILALLLFGGCAAALAAGGSASDPLVSKSYLEGTYIPTVTAQMKTRASEKTAAVYTAAENTLKAKAQAYLSQVGGSTASGSTGVCPLKREDQVTVSTGSGLVVQNGTVRLSHGGTVVDVTTGSEAASGTALTANHRYLVAENTSATFTVVSETATVAIQGSGTVRASTAKPLPFSDILTTDWYYEDVRFVYEKGLYNGTTDTTFTPGGAMTRGMMATVLYRLAGNPTVSGSGTAFRDVPASAYYASAVVWANGNGLVLGYPDGTFQPNATITREQLATLIYRYAKDYAKLSVKPTGSLTSFPDYRSVSTWAEDGLKWAVAQGLVQGTGTGLQPSGQATRAQVAAILHRFSALL